MLAGGISLFSRKLRFWVEFICRSISLLSEGGASNMVMAVLKKFKYERSKTMAKKKKTAKKKKKTSSTGPRKR